MNCMPCKISRCLTLILSVIFVPIITAAPRAAETPARLVLVEDGKARTAIVIQSNKGLAPGLAKILAAHLEQMSGAKIPITLAKDLKLGQVVIDGGVVRRIDSDLASLILLGESDLTRGLGLSGDKLPAGGFVIQTEGNMLALFGKPDGAKSPGGDSYAVYRFLEHLGCRWLWPGESGKVIPKLATITVGPLALRDQPRLAERKIRFGSLDREDNIDKGLERLSLTKEECARAIESAKASQAGGDWADWQGLGGRLDYAGGHNGAGLGSDGLEKYGKTHPEWFALQADGSRDQTAVKNNRWRLCVSNLELIECVTNKIIADLKREPVACVSLSPNDGGYASFCMCEACKKLDPPEAPKVEINIFAHAGQPQRTPIQYPSLSDRYVWYWNHVAERVTKVFPDQLFSVDAYSAYQTPPVRQKLHPNFVVRYVPSSIEGWVGWQQAGARRIYWRPNILNAGAGEGTLNRFAALDIAGNMNYLAERAMFATDFDTCHHHWATMGLVYYVTARLNWNPALKYDEVVEDYCRAGFGKAAAPVRNYFALVAELRDIVTEKRGVGKMTNYTPEAIAKMRLELAKADRLGGDDAALKGRIAFLRAGLEFTAITAEAMRLKLDAEAGSPVDLKKAASLMERRWNLMRETAQKQPLAVNMIYVAGYEEPLWRPLKWKPAK